VTLRRNIFTVSLGPAVLGGAEVAEGLTDGPTPLAKPSLGTTYFQSLSRSVSASGDVDPDPSRGIGFPGVLMKRPILERLLHAGST